MPNETDVRRRHESRSPNRRQADCLGMSEDSFDRYVRPCVQDLADRLLAEGLDASTVKNTLNPLQAIYRRAVSRGQVAVNPTTNFELPATRGRRDRVVPPEQARRLLAALDDVDRPLWAAAIYAGLRRGELQALRGTTSISARA